MKKTNNNYYTIDENKFEDTLNFEPNNELENVNNELYENELEAKRNSKFKDNVKNFYTKIINIKNQDESLKKGQWYLSKDIDRFGLLRLAIYSILFISTLGFFFQMYWIIGALKLDNSGMLIFTSIIFICSSIVLFSFVFLLTFFFFLNYKINILLYFLVIGICYTLFAIFLPMIMHLNLNQYGYAKNHSSDYVNPLYIDNEAVSYLIPVMSLAVVLPYIILGLLLFGIISFVKIKKDYLIYKKTKSTSLKQTKLSTNEKQTLIKNYINPITERTIESAFDISLDI